LPCPITSPPSPRPPIKSAPTAGAPRQRHFLETLAATGVITTACEAVHISPRSAYALRIRRDGAAFRLGWDAAILIARARLADELLARALTGHEEVIHRQEDTITRRRHDNRLAMSMLSRLDRMADNPPEGSDAALARVVAQDFAAYLDLICPEDRITDQPDQPDPAPAHAHAPDMDEAALADLAAFDPALPDRIEATATALSPGASAALFIAARMALQDGKRADPHPSHEHCELRPQIVDRATLPPDEAAARLRGAW
jgi:hypothetical protein